MAKFWVTLGVLVLLVFWGGSMFVNYSNQEIQLASQVKAQQKNNQVVFDTTWKIISQTAQVSENYKDSFANIYPDIMNGRYGNARGGALMSWVTESNPNFDISLYQKLIIAIEAQRTNFANEQKKLIDLDREHQVLCTTFPGSLFLGSRADLKINIVTSAKTEEAFKTGQDNDTKLFR